MHKIDRVVVASSSATNVVCACSTPGHSWQAGGVCSMRTLRHYEGAEAGSVAMAGAPSCPSSLLILFMVLSFVSALSACFCILSKVCNRPILRDRILAIVTELVNSSVPYHFCSTALQVDKTLG